MITSYILVLAVSACLASMGLTYVSQRVNQLFGRASFIPAGLGWVLSMLGFLVVVAAPAPVLVGGVALIGASMLQTAGYLPPLARWGVPFVVAALAASTLSLPAIPGVPTPALYCVALAVLFGLIHIGNKIPEDMATTSLSALAMSAPLLFAPLLGAPAFLAVDSMIIASALLGACLVMRALDVSVALVRPPRMLLLGWMMLTSAAHGAWAPATISLLVVAGVVAYGLSRQPFAQPPHAS